MFQDTDFDPAKAAAFGRIIGQDTSVMDVDAPLLKRKAEGSPAKAGVYFGSELDKRSRGLYNDFFDDSSVGHRVGVIKSSKELFSSVKHPVSSYDENRSVLVHHAGKIDLVEKRKSDFAKRKGFGSWAAYQKHLRDRKDESEYAALNRSYIKGYLSTDDPYDDDLRWKAFNALRRENYRADTGNEEENRLAKLAGFSSMKALRDAEVVASLKRRTEALKERTWGDLAKDAVFAGLQHAGPLGSAAATVFHDYRTDPLSVNRARLIQHGGHLESDSDYAKRIRDEDFDAKQDALARKARMRELYENVGYAVGDVVTRPFLHKRDAFGYSATRPFLHKRNYRRFQGHY